MDMHSRSFARAQVLFCFFVVVAGVLLPSELDAAVVISSASTQNMSCSGGLCTPTAVNAVLNTSDVENMLATGTLTVATAGSGVDAQDIDVRSGFSWSTTSVLSLRASVAIAIDAEVSSTGMGEVSLSYLEFNRLTFGHRGRISLQNLSSPIMVNGTAYTLVNSITSLASAVASNSSGAYAFADDYDASQDGTYSAAPIQTAFSGTLEGLGNTISHLSINDQSPDQQLLGLFYYIVEPALIEHVRLDRTKIVGGRKKTGDFAGTLVGYNATGYLFQSSATGTIRLMGNNGMAGGLAAANNGQIDACFAEVSVDSGRSKGATEVGGLVGGNSGTIGDSFATGQVISGNSNLSGGLVGGNDHGAIESDYSTGAVKGDVASQVGGLTGRNEGEIEFSYSTGAVAGGSSSFVGGFAGTNIRTKTLSDNYWDTTTSGTTQGVGEGSAKNVTGLTTHQLQFGLPNGFDPAIWGEKATINNGLPYLLKNPPPR